MPNKNKVIIIAEAGVNHNGSIQRAIDMVDVAASSGADYIKFQSFKAEHLVTRAAPKAEYQLHQTKASESQFEMLKSLELDDQMHKVILNRCIEKKIAFLSTPFDHNGVRYLAEDLNMPVLKISSGDLTNPLVLLAAGRSGKKIILSTGMATLAEIEIALSILAFSYVSDDLPSSSGFVKAWSSFKGAQAVKNQVTILHCTTEYPAPFKDVNLRAMQSIHRAFGVPVGYSDHTLGTTIPVAAVALGATVIEKHFTMDKTLVGPDHAASLDLGELKTMVRQIREIELALGSSVKSPAESEVKNIQIARKSIVASKDIQQGEVLSLDNLTAKRPANGISPIKIWDFIGKTASRKYKKDDMLENE